MYKVNSRIASQMRVCLSRHVASACDFGEGDSVPINQNPSKSFNVDPDTGRPMSEISALLRSESAAEQMALFSQLQDYKSEFLPPDISDEDAIKYVVPRYIQLPSQIADFQASLRASKDIQKINDENARIKAEQAAAADSAAAASSPAPAAASAVAGS